MKDKYSVISILAVSARRKRDGYPKASIYDDTQEMEKACELTAAANAMAGWLLKHNSDAFRVRTAEAAKPYGQRSGKHLVHELVLSYGTGRWSLLSDKPTRPAVKAPEPVTLDA